MYGTSFSLLTWGKPSIASPVTLNKRPLIRSPAGIAIATPVSTTSGTTDEAFCTVHRDGTNAVFTEVLLHFKNEFVAVGPFELQCVINLRKVPSVNSTSTTAPMICLILPLLAINDDYLEGLKFWRKGKGIRISKFTSFKEYHLIKRGKPKALPVSAGGCCIYYSNNIKS